MTDTQSNATTRTVTAAFEQPDWYITGYAANIRVRCETVSSYTTSRKFERVLDAGCGDGSLSLPLLRQGSEVTFLDLSRTMLERVKTRIPTNLVNRARLLHGDFTQTDLAASSFDLILFVGVFAYLPDIAEIANRIGRLVRPGGMIITECTDAGHFISRLNFTYRDLTAIVRPGKCQTYRHKAIDVVKAFERAGFELRHSFRYTYTVPILSRFLNHQRAYALMRLVYGSAEASRRQRMGSESLLLFEA
jgi:2-polyprenyl-3-methyl-5-hydroxy-6-metoxy-1,4-benzoquinol methylase